MEPTGSRPAASLPSGLDSPTDRLICGLLATEPMTSPEIAARLAVSARTVRHRLMRLRQAGVVTAAVDGIYRVEALAAGTLLAAATPGGDLAETGPQPASRKTTMVLAIIGAFAAGCIGVAIWAARHVESGKPATQAAAPPSPWPYGVGRLGPGSW